MTPTPTLPLLAEPVEPAVGAQASLLLSFVAGFVDTFGFIALFGLFTAHVTGNFVLIGAALASGNPSAVVGKLLALPTFIAGVMLTRAYQLRRARLGLPSGVHLIAAQLLLLVVFALSGALNAPYTAGNTLPAVLVGLLGVLTMSVQNAASRSTFAKMSPSTVMTGNVTQWTMDLVDRLLGATGAQAAATRMRTMGPAIAAFAAGSLGGGLGYACLGFWALLAPVAALALLLRRLMAAQPA